MCDSSALKGGGGYRTTIRHGGGGSDGTTAQSVGRYSTVTDLARFRGWSTSVPFSTAT